MDSITIGQMNEARDLGIDASEVGCNCSHSVGSNDEFDDISGDEDERFGEFVGLDDDLADIAQIGFSFPNPIKALGQAFKQIEHNVEKVPVLSQVARLAVSPIHVIKNIAKGERLDHVLVGELKNTAKNAKELAPYVQAVISVVPGIGTGLSAGLGGALALAQGKSINQAVIEAVKGALPGGPAAQAAFSVAAGVMEGKPIDQIALGALPIDASAKQALMKGLTTARALASGQSVSHVLMDEAMKNLPDTVKKALQVGTALGHAKALQELAGNKLSSLAANTLLKSGGLSSLQKVLANPTVSSMMGPVSIPGHLLLAVVKGGSQSNAVQVAMNALHDPSKQAAVRAAALSFSPTTPAPVAFGAVAKVVDALRSKDVTAAVKAAAQIAATTALAKSGDPGAMKALDLINRAKTIAKRLPTASDLTNLTHGRVEVCGAKSDENRGIWLKSHIFREGNFLCMTVYSVANANAEVFNFKLDLVPILKGVASYHKKLHGDAPMVGAGFGDVMNQAAVKLGRAKLAQKAFSVSTQLAAKAACNVQTPNVPVSNAVLATYAAARAGVDAVDKNAKLKRAMESVGGNVAKLIAVKKHLASLTPAQRVNALKDPTIRAAILSGIGSKIALAKFVKSGGPKVASTTRRNALIASKQFSTLAAKVKAGDPNAKKMAAVISVAAKARAKTQQTVQRGTSGSQAGFVITAQGKVRKNHAGFQKRTPRPGEHSEVLVHPHGGIETGVFDHVAGDDDDLEIGATAAQRRAAAAKKKALAHRKALAARKLALLRRARAVKLARLRAARARAHGAAASSSQSPSQMSAPSQSSSSPSSSHDDEPGYDEPEEQEEPEHAQAPDDESADDDDSESSDQGDQSDDVSGSSAHYTSRLRNRLAAIRKLAIINGVDELIGCSLPLAPAVSGRQYFPDLSQAEKRYLIKQNAAWAEKFTQRALARERVQAILKRRQRVKVGVENEDGEVDFESDLPYDTFVQDPYREDDVQADMAF